MQVFLPLLVTIISPSIQRSVLLLKTPTNSPPQSPTLHRSHRKPTIATPVSHTVKGRSNRRKHLRRLLTEERGGSGAGAASSVYHRPTLQRRASIQ